MESNGWIIGAIVGIISLQISILGLMGKIAWDMANRFGAAETKISVLAEKVEHVESMIEQERRFEQRAKDRGYIK